MNKEERRTGQAVAAKPDNQISIPGILRDPPWSSVFHPHTGECGLRGTELRATRPLADDGSWERPWDPAQPEGTAERLPIG